MEQRKFWLAVASVAAVTLIAIIVFWATQFVWIPIILTGVTMLVREYRVCSRIEWQKYVIFVGVGVVSTFLQFFNTEIVYELTLGRLFLAVAVVGLFVFFIAMAVVSMLQNNAERKEKRKQERQLAEEKKQYDELHLLFTTLLNKANAADKVMWDDMKTLYTQCEQLKMNRAILHAAYTKVDLLKLLKYSTVKQHVVWQDGNFGEALRHFNQVIKECFDDAILEKLIQRIEALGTLCGYKGYKEMHKMISERISSTIITLPEPAELQSFH